MVFGFKLESKECTVPEEYQYEILDDPEAPKVFMGDDGQVYSDDFIKVVGVPSIKKVVLLTSKT